MDNKVIYEAIENTSYLARLILKSEIAMNDADVESCQKYTKEAQNLLATLIKDVYAELTETINQDSDTVNDYELATGLELTVQLNTLVYDLSRLLLSQREVNELILTKTKQKIITDINTIKEINNAIYAN